MLTSETSKSKASLEAEEANKFKIKVNKSQHNVRQL